jgi:glycine betaine/proline transport system substrate-binding protein
VHTVITDRLMQEGGIAVDYLANRIFPGEAMNAMLVYMTDNQATGEAAAFEFLATHEDIWTQWVTEDAAAAIRSAL